MRRRDLLAGLLATTAASALSAAEPDKVYRLAVCTPFGLDHRSHLFSRLRQLGYAEGQNLIVDRYVAGLRPEYYAEIAREMVQQSPDAIALAVDNQLISEIAKETHTIPIIALIPSIDAGLVRNMSRPEGNITGVTLDAGIEMQGKLLDILRQAVPTASRIAYLSNRYDWEGAWGRAVLDASRRSGVSIIGIPVEHSAGEEDYRKAFETMVQDAADALIFNGLAPNAYYSKLIATLAFTNRLPSICWNLDVVRKGPGFLCYTPKFGGTTEKWADQIDQVLRGAKVSDIPIYQPTKFILAINLKTAKALALEIPTSLISIADEVIE